MIQMNNSEEFFEQTVSAKDHHMLCVCNVTLRRVTRYLRSLALMTLRCFHLSGYSPEFIFIVMDDSRNRRQSLLAIIKFSSVAGAHISLFQASTSKWQVFILQQSRDINGYLLPNQTTDASVVWFRRYLVFCEAQSIIYIGLLPCFSLLFIHAF